MPEWSVALVVTLVVFAHGFRQQSTYDWPDRAISAYAEVLRCPAAVCVSSVVLQPCGDGSSEARSFLHVGIVPAALEGMVRRPRQPLGASYPYDRWS